MKLAHHFAINASYQASIIRAGLMGGLGAHLICFCSCLVAIFILHKLAS